MALYSQVAINKAVRRAGDAVRARLAGATEYTPPGGQTFDLEKGGMCAKFVRQVFETSMGLDPFTWRFGSVDATGMLRKLAKCLPKLPPGAVLKPGDIIGHRRGPHGHIGIVIGGPKELYAENTIAHRGDPFAPGTKWTRVSDWQGKYECYRLGPD